MDRKRIAAAAALTCLAVLVAASIGLRPATAEDPGPEDAEQWVEGDPITVSITAPANNTYLPINHSQSLTATATDPDCYRVGTTWYPYWDEVEDGEEEADHHMWWTADIGECTEEYGTTGVYEAPGYSEGNNVRDATITAHADDFNRGEDTEGANDTPAATASITLKVWQITLTVAQTGTTSTNYDGEAVPAWLGGTDLGWVIPGTPAGSLAYAGNTQVKGSIPAGPNVTTGYQWYQVKKGITRYKKGGTWNYALNSPTVWVADIDPAYDYLDADSRHPNGAEGTDVREIFLLDAPFWVAGALNNNKIAAPDSWTDIEYDVDFKPKVNLNGIIISNEPIYEVIFTLDVNGGTWRVVGNHTPAS